MRSDLTCEEVADSLSAVLRFSSAMKDRLLIIIIQPAGTSNKICFSRRIFFIHPLIFPLHSEISVLIGSEVLAASQVLNSY